MTVLEDPRAVGRLKGWRSGLAWLAVLVLAVAAYLLVCARSWTRATSTWFGLLLLGSAVAPATVLVFAVSGGRHVIAPTGLVVLTALAEA